MPARKLAPPLMRESAMFVHRLHCNQNYCSYLLKDPKRDFGWGGEQRFDLVVEANQCERHAGHL